MTRKWFFLTVVPILVVLWMMPSVLAGQEGPSAQTRLSPDKAFALSFARANAHSVMARWQIAKGYHLYKSRIRIENAPKSKVRIGAPLFPKGIAQHDNIMGNYEVYKGNLDVRIPVINPADGQLKLLVRYQGCRGKIDCYPPIKKQIALNVNKLPLIHAGSASGNRYANLFLTHHLLYILLMFLGVGVLLAFTPCVLPMIPILSGIILGQGNKLSMRRGFSLTLIYVLSMSLTFSLAGVFAGYAGRTLQAMLQTPIVIGLFSLLLVVMALSLFGLFELQIPAFIQNRIYGVNAKQQSGTYVGAAVMGCLATLIASPCVTAPLVGLLIYISSTGNAALGGLALFVMGLGMGLPLLAFGTIGARYLPRAGRWMNIIKVIFGVLLLGLAIWMISRVIPFGHVSTSHVKHDRFQTVTTLAQLNTELKMAKKAHRPVLVDYYADWCVACKEMEVGVFRDSKVLKALSRFELVRVDVTANNQATRELEKKYHVFAPPSIVFFDANDDYLQGKNLDGQVNAKILIDAVGHTI